MLYAATERKKQAEDDLVGAREIGSRLAEKSLDSFGRDYANTLNQLAILYRAGRLPLAADTYIELAKVYKELADIEEDTYPPEFARTIYNLAGVYGMQQNWDMCAKSCELLHTLYTQLWKKDPAAYADKLADASLMIVEVMIQQDGSRSRACSLLKEAREVARDDEKRQLAEKQRRRLVCPSKVSYGPEGLS